MKKRVPSLFDSVFKSPLHPVTSGAVIALGVTLAMATAIASQSALDEISYNAEAPVVASLGPVAAQPKVLGESIKNISFEANSPELMHGQDCEQDADETGTVCLSYDILKYNAQKGKWSAKVSYDLKGIKSGSLSLNEKKLVSQIKKSGSRNLSFVLEPDEIYTLTFYSEPDLKGDELVILDIVAPSAPELAQSPTQTSLAAVNKPEENKKSEMPKMENQKPGKESIRNESLQNTSESLHLEIMLPKDARAGKSSGGGAKLAGALNGGVVYEIDWGDGSRSSTIDGKNFVPHTWQSSGTFTVTVIATVPDGQTFTKSANVTVLGSAQ